MRHTGEAAQGRLDHGGLEAGLQGHGRGHQHVLEVVVTRHRQGIGGEQGTLRPQHLPLLDPQAGPQSRRQLRLRSGGDPLGRLPAGGAGSQVGVVAIENPHRSVLEQAALDRPVVIKGAVPLQVVRRERGPDADGGRQLGGLLDLIAAQLDHQPVGPGALAPQALQGHLRGGDPDVAALRRLQTALAEQVMHEMGDGGLAVRAGDAHPGDGAGGPGRHSHLTENDEARRAHPLQFRMIPADARADDHGGRSRIGQRFERQRNAQAHGDALGLKGVGSSLLVNAIATFQQRHRMPLAVEEPGHTDAGAPETDDRHRTAGGRRHRGGNRDGAQ